MSHGLAPTDVWSTRRRLRADSVDDVHTQLCAEIIRRGFDRGLVLTVEPNRTLSAEAVRPLAHEPSDALRRQVRGMPIGLAPGSLETELIRACAAGRAPNLALPSAIAEALGLSSTSAAVVAPESRALALLIGVSDDDAPSAERDAALHLVAHVAEGVLESLVLKSRLRALEAELRFLAASALAHGREAVETPIALTADQPQGLSFPPAADPVRGLTSDVLTPREREMLQLIAEGRTNKDIAAELNLSIETVKDYVGRLLRKLGAGNRVEAVARYLQRGGEL